MSPLHSRSRTRLLVIQVMVLSLFATLLARLWYLQVAGVQTYQAAAVSNSVRGVEIAAPRGLIVDDQGRPLVANRTSWVVTVDRSVLDKLSNHARHTVLSRLAGTLGISRSTLVQRTKTCGEPGAARAPLCWNGSPYAPVPVAEDVRQQVAAAILERSEDYPSVRATAQQVRAYPAPYGVNAAHVLGYVSPITGPELKADLRRGETGLNGQSMVGRSGMEQTYDDYLRGTPGVKEVSVDSMGRVIGDKSVTAPIVGDTLVTSIDAKVQSVVEHQLAGAILNARKTVDPVTGRKFVADSGSAIVLNATNGRVVAMASYPSYNPNVWVGGITQKDLNTLYSPSAGLPLLDRADQGQYAPGSTFKPFNTAGALTHGFSPRTRLDCSSSFQVGSQTFKNYESEAFGNISFAQALQVSCDTFFYRVGYAEWVRSGANPRNVHADDPLVDNAKMFGFGRPTGIDLSGEVAGRIADRRWKLAYWKANKAYYCRLGRSPKTDFIHVFAREFCVDGWQYRAGDAVNFAIGQGDTLLTPLQLAVAYGALANGGTLWKPRIGEAVVSPDGTVVKRIAPQVASKVKVPPHVLRYIDTALLGTAKVGTMAWKMVGFPLDKVQIRSKTGTAEVYGKQTTSWVATYNKQYVVLMQISQGGTGSGTSGDAIRKIWESLYGIHGMTVDRAKGDQPGAKPPRSLPVFESNGTIAPPVLRAPGRDYDSWLSPPVTEDRRRR
jgi:penicillin-binding protein 2